MSTQHPSNCAAVRPRDAQRPRRDAPLERWPWRRLEGGHGRWLAVGAPDKREALVIRGYDKFVSPGADGPASTVSRAMGLGTRRDKLVSVESGRGEAKPEAPCNGAARDGGGRERLRAGTVGGPRRAEGRR